MRPTGVGAGDGCGVGLGVGAGDGGGVGFGVDGGGVGFGVGFGVDGGGVGTGARLVTSMVSGAMSSMVKSNCSKVIVAEMMTFSPTGGPVPSSSSSSPFEAELTYEGESTLRHSELNCS